LYYLAVRWPWSRKQRVEFDSAPRPIVEMFAEMLRSAGTTATRSEALSVPAVRRGRNMLCAIATMPLEQLAPDNTVTPSALLRQLDPDVPNVVTLAQTVEDLLFEGIAWWEVTAKDFAEFPTAVRRLDPLKVSLTPPKGQYRSPAPLPSDRDPRGAVVWVDGVAVGADRIIRFDSPNPAVLHHAGREIRRAILFDNTAGMYAENPTPLDYFSPADGADPASDDDIKEILSGWKAARKRRSTGYVPASLRYNSVDAPNPQQLQLAELGKQATLDIANSIGIDPEDLGLSTTSRTYSNDVDRRRNKLNEVLAPYMRAVTDRLSMGDVTRRGYTVRFNTVEYLMPNPGERWAIYSTTRGAAVISDDEVRQAEGMAPMEDQEAPAEQAPVAPSEAEPAEEATVTPIDAARQPAYRFDGAETFDLDLPVVEFSVDAENRIIEGLTLPYGKVGMKGGVKFRFDRGALQWNLDNPGRVKLVFPGHNDAVGKAIQLKDTPRGMLARFKVGRGAEGDRALESADDGVHDGFSVGVDFNPAVDTVVDPKDKSVMLVRRADLRHVALTAEPVFDDARVTRVAASRTEGEAVADEDTTTTVEPPAAPDPDAAPAAPVVPATPEPPTAGLQLSRETLAAVLAVPGAYEAITHQPAPEAPAAAASLNLSVEQIGQLMELGRANAAVGAVPAAPADVERPTVVDPTRSLNLAVTSEELPYRFDRGGRFATADHEFSTDVVDMIKRGDHDGSSSEAGKRVMAFIRAKFSTVAVGDVNELNPDIQRPDMYVDQRDFRYPLWESIQKGPPPNGVQPFVFPKFSSASGLVGAHTEGVEPTGGTFVTTSQTVTPTALSGKASLTREIWDTGGNPAVSTLIWNQMVRGYREARESAAATFLNTLTAATDINLGVAVFDSDLVAAWDTAVADLQFVRGYDFEMFAVEQRLYRAFVDATDSDGRKLVPQITPTNANGQAERRFTQLDLAGVTGVPAWALTATPGAANNSWLFDPMTVHGWATEPQRLDLLGSGGTAAGADYKPVAFVDIGIWGYSAFANSDIGGVRQVIFDDA
jgi:phage head maturation protease